jgi:hypothetical protein
MDFVVQLWRFLGARRKYWLLPIIVIVVVLGGLFHSRMRQYFSEQAKARGYQVLDGSRFEAAPTDGHWNALANRLVAEQIEKSAVFARVFPKRSIPARQDSAYLSR